MEHLDSGFAIKLHPEYAGFLSARRPPTLVYSCPEFQLWQGEYRGMVIRTIPAKPRPMPHLPISTLSTAGRTALA